MVKTVLSVGHYGLRDWVIQRLSALIMMVYCVGIVAFLLCHPGLTFAEWHSLFSHLFVKIATILFLFSLLWHAWIGMWTVYTDYVKPFILRAMIQTLTILGLLACAIWGLLILWSV